MRGYARNPIRQIKLTRAQSERRAAECDALPGLPREIFDKQKVAAEFRLRVIDAEAKPWRDLCNEFPHQAVATVYEQTSDPKEARRLLIARFGRPI